MDTFQVKISALLEGKDLLELKNLLTRMNPADLAELISLVPPAQKATIFRLLEKPQAVEVLNTWKLMTSSN